MCTSIVYENKANNFFLARTMDFSFPLGGSPIFIPKDYTFYADNDSKNFDVQYSFVGSGRHIEDYLFADGVNEEGLGVASLYFSDDANYTALDDEAEHFLAPHDVVAWLLSSFKTVVEVKKGIASQTIKAEECSVIGNVLPLHWIVSDQKGETIVIEPTKAGLIIYDNPVKVMTNSPDFSWHLTNLNQYNQLSNTTLKESSYHQFLAKGNGAGSGALGLPGDYTSISRFVRTAFISEHIEKVSGFEESINVITRLLSSVFIPKGIKKKENGKDDYTQFVSYMALNDCSYVINYYETNQLFKVDLKKMGRTQHEIKEFKCSKDLQIELLQ
ncbi:choloylglycine hydrolase family protein [Vagococcus carniphilus]|uniref:choloylglycine hydrolase family protein n=1 Tax=Vagococcus carniphilus TaxID=218144 RepID=UPI003B5CEDC0